MRRPKQQVFSLVICTTVVQATRTMGRVIVFMARATRFKVMTIVWLDMTTKLAEVKIRSSEAAIPCSVQWIAKGRRESGALSREPINFIKTPMKSLELKVPPLAQLAIAVLCLWAIGALFPTYVLTFPYRVESAILMGILGAIIAVTGVISFRLHKTTVNPLTPEKSIAVVRTGIYRISRNPMYLGMLLSGCALLLANWIACVVVLPLFAWYMTTFQIIPEERSMIAKFGEEYQAYLHSVSRWL
jgi:protein-S-isoprenylcysteine O-methyltransferase Ste14